MQIPRLSVNRPVTTLMLFLGVVILGLISWTRLPQELFPSITYPQITVVTSYENAAPEEIENLITKIIEETVGTVNNVKRITSISKEGLSLVMIEFNWGANMDFAALNVREKIDLIKERLPRESQEPVVMKYNPFDLPIMNLAITGPMSALELREVCRRYIKDAIEKIDGVASAIISGGEEREILVEIDQPRLRASQVSIVSVVDALKSANINYPAGTIKESFYEYLIRTMGEYQKIEEIPETPTALDIPEEEAKTQKEKEEKEKQGRRLVFLRDIAQVKDTVKEKTSISRYNGKDSVSLVIRKQSGTNTLSIVRKVQKEIQKLLQEKLPKGIKIQVTYDQSKFIKEAIANVRNAAVQGGILAFFVLLFILRDLRSSLVITTSIPISILATLCLMYFSKINLNMMSLGGLALGVGMLVDNSVVVIENIFRHRKELKKEIKTACIEGTNEMFSAVMGSTLTTVAVFLPFAFVVGVVGQIFKQLSFTITFSLLASITTAVALVPVLNSLGRTRQFSFSKPSSIISQQKLSGLNTMYENFIRSMLKMRFVVIGLVLGAFILSLGILSKTERQFLPRVDQRQFIIKVDLAPGTRLEVTDRVVKTIEHLLLKLPETQDVTVNIGSSEEKISVEQTALQTLGSHQAQIMVNLKKKSKKSGITRSTDEVIQYLKDNLKKHEMENVEIEYIAQETSFGAALEQGAPIAIEIKGPELNQLQEISLLVQRQINTIEGLYGIKSSMPSPSPETKLNILKDKASLYGLSVRDIAITTQVALKGYVATKFKEKVSEEDVDIRVRLRPEDRSDLGNLRRLLIHSPLGMDVPLSEVAYLTKGRGPTEIKRIDQQRGIVITANIFKRNFNQVVADINAVLNALTKKIPKDYIIELTGEQQRMKESFASLAFAMALAFALVYMIMAAEFESLWQPFLIMFTIPLSLIGVTFSLSLTRTPLSSVAYLGIIMLGGIAVNNAIVFMESLNQLIKGGRPLFEALVEASRMRLRPIMLTSLTTVFGLIPLALGIGEGSELQAPLAITVMGGLLSSTFLTLVFIPCLFLFIANILRLKPAPTAQIILPAEEPKPQEPVITPSLKPAEEMIPTEIPEKIEKSPLETKPELNERQIQLLERLKTQKRITRKEYAEIFGVSIPTAARDLKELIERGLIKAYGPLGPGRWYELT
ncbi:MAG: efflux RND transporter permease subunit [Candidatus Omnitrophica bacterium]|nr:efflux RND transporter permease subunit [Candidatus Omnitrophota bacterium]